MAYAIKYSLDVVWIGDGASSMSVPAAQRLKLVQSSLVQVPGGDSPSQANFNTAIGVTSGNVITNSMASDLEAQIATNLTKIQAWSTGGG
jgi:hypothetical protein